MKNTNFDIYTSFVSPYTWNKLVKERNYLPIIAVRNIKDSSLIGKFSNTAVHFKEFSPSNELFRAKRNGEISLEEFKKKYLIELSKTSIYSNVEKIYQLFNVSGASGIVIFGYGSDYNSCHRSVLSEMLNLMEVFEEEIKEYKV